MFLPLRDENPTRGAPWFTLLLIAANALAFVPLLGASAEQVISQYGLVPTRFVASNHASGSSWITLFSSMFLHANFIHLGGNLLYLWIFGNNVEDELGHFRFLLFYVLVGLGAHLAHILANSSSPIPTIGASGAISGVLAAYLIRFPRAHVISLIFLFFFVRVIRVRAEIVIGFWLIAQIVGTLGEVGTSAGDEGGVAWFEHVGGFLAGVLFYPLLGGRRAGARV
jgi:membrane associated rhomboid family serine protease